MILINDQTVVKLKGGKMKKSITLTVGLMMAVSLGGCGKQQTSAKQSSTSVQSKRAGDHQLKKRQAYPVMKMNQIKAGNYQSLKGNWTEILTGVNRQDSTGLHFTDGGSDTLHISNELITNNQQPLLRGDTLFDQGEQHKVVFEETKGFLTASLANQMTAVNWSVTFYPVGTTSQYQADSNGKNTQNLIVVWTSNNSYTQVFAQAANGKHSTKSTTNQSDSSGQAASSQQPTDKTAGQSVIDLSQIGANNFTSLVGTWKNDAGQTIVVTDQVVNKPAGSSVTFDKGAVVSGQDHDGYPTVIASGSVSDGYMNGSMGSFDPNIKMSPFEPLAIVPKGVQLSAGDHSDSTKDRLIVGGIQSTSSDDVYYHQ